LIDCVAVYALFKVLALKVRDCSQRFPIYRVGIVALSSILAALIFKEKLSRQKTLGLVVGMAAVGLLNR
jgi:multidrug transporter EmrE-like cation transporter